LCLPFAHQFGPRQAPVDRDVVFCRGQVACAQRQVAVFLLAVRLALVFAFLSFATLEIRARLFRCSEKAFGGKGSPIRG
jgi:hypothetical protein